MRKQIIFALAAISLGLFARAAYVVHAQAATAAELRSQLVEKYDVVPLQQGIALVPKRADARVRMIEIVDGTATIDGQTMTAAQLRERLGPEAAAIVQLTYLDQAALRQLASDSPTAPPPGVGEPQGRARPTVRDGDIVRFAGPVTVREDELVRGDVVAIMGPANIDGEVTGEVTVVMGPLTLGPHAVVRRDVTVVGGPLTRAEGAVVSGKIDEVAIGNGIRAPRVGVSNLLGSFWGRVGSLAATVARVLLMVLLSLIAMAVGRRTVEQIAARAAAEPVRSALIGLLAEILFVPVVLVTVFALLISIIGIPLLALVPFGLVVIGLVMLVGFTGAAYLAGQRALHHIGRQEPGPYATVAAGAFVIAAITLLAKLASLLVGSLFGVPLAVVGYVIEYLAWTVGFGAAILAWIRLRRHPAPPMAPAMPGTAS